MKKEFDLIGYSILVDNQEQAKKLQQYAFKQGFTWRYSNSTELKYLDKKSFQFGKDKLRNITFYSDGTHFENEEITKKAHYNDLFIESPQDKVNRLELELNQAKQELEDSKPKVGQWVVSNINNCVFRYIPDRVTDDLEIITDKKLIKKLDNLIKEEFVLPEKWFLENKGECEIKTWLKEKTEYYNNYGLVISNENYGNSFQNWNSNIKESKNMYLKRGYTEITFEQFKKYVLKNEI